MAAPRSAATVLRHGESSFELVPDVSPRRASACIAVHPADKEVFDRLQAYLAARRGRPVFQWDAFSVLLADALENPSGRSHVLTQWASARDA